MRGTYYTEQDGPLQPQLTMDLPNLAHFHYYTPQTQSTYSGSFNNINTNSVSFQHQEINTDFQCQTFTLPGLNLQGQTFDLVNQEAIKQLEMVNSAAFANVQTGLGLYNNSANIDSSKDSYYGLSALISSTPEQSNAFPSFQQNQQTNQSQRSLEAYCQVLSLMPFRDDEPIPKYVSNVNMENHLSLSVETETSDLYIDTAKAQSIPVKVTLGVSPLEMPSRTPLDIVCVIEKSNDVLPMFFKEVQKSINKLLDNLNENDRLSIVLYDDFGYRLTHLSRMNEDNKETVREGLHNIYLSGGSDLADGVGQAVEIIRQRRYVNPTTCLLILGSGNDSKSMDTLDFLFQKYANEKFYVHAFHPCGTSGKTFNWLANRRNGAYCQIEKEDELSSSLMRALSAMSQIQSHEAELYFFTNMRIQPAGGLDKLNGENFAWSIPEKCYKVKVPYLAPGFSEEFKLEVAIPKLSKSLKGSEHMLNVLDVIYRVETLDSIVMKKENLHVRIFCDTNDESTADQDQVEENFVVDDEAGSYFECAYTEKRKVSITSLEKVNKLVVVEELMLEANKMLHLNRLDEARKIAKRLRCQAQGLGMEFEVVIKSFLERVYQNSYKDGTEEMMEE